MKNKLKGSIALLSATVIWGSAFVAQSVGMDYIGPFTFQTLRCLLAVLFLIPAAAVLERTSWRQYAAQWLDKKLWLAGTLCGLALFAATTLQQVGLVYTDAGKAGFLTAMYIVLVPFIGLFLKRRLPMASWLSIAVAVVGLYLLSNIGASIPNPGDMMMVGCALAFAVQITFVDRFAAHCDALRLNCIQSLVVTVLSAVCMFATESPEWRGIAACALPISYAGILSLGVAYSLQIIGQRHVEPTTASLFMSLESVFAALSGWLLLNEQMTPRELTGCLLIFLSVIITQIPAKKAP